MPSSTFVLPVRQAGWLLTSRIPGPTQLGNPAISGSCIDGQSETTADSMDEAIDDSSDWEDEGDKEDRKILFERVGPLPNLARQFHQSLISQLFAKAEKAQQYANIASQTTSASPRMIGTRMGKSRAPPIHCINEVVPPNAQPIVALSPRTTRHNMLSSELTESLRSNLLWERKQKTSTANAVLKRRYTSQDIASLRQYPDKAHMKEENNADANTWDRFLDRDQLKVW